MSIDFPNRSTARNGAAGCSWVLIAVAVVFALGLVFVIADFAFGWAALPFQVHGVANVREQYRKGYDYDGAMKSAAAQYCTAATAAAQPGMDPSVKAQRDSQRIAQEGNYARIKGEYDAFMADPIRAKNVKPDDLPATAPTLQQRATTVCGH
jgi:hypothetical protein